MIPVIQSKVVVRNSKEEIVVNGNCYAAAIASILELPLSEVPNVEVLFDIDGLWENVMKKWLWHKGYEIRINDDYRVFHDGRYGIEEGKRAAMMGDCKDKYYLVSGPSVRGVNHICIYQNGKMVHDPHPTKEGITQLLWFEEIVKKPAPTDK